MMTDLGLVCVSIFGDCDMSRRNCHPPHHESPHEQRLREIVDELVPDDSQKRSYLAFALELARSFHRAPVPDYEPGTKRVVMKWFERGLHGRLLRLVGQAVIQEKMW